MVTIKDMDTSLKDAHFFNDKIENIVRGPQSGHDIDVIRRYFRAYLHCWKTVLHFVRKAKGLDDDADWIRWAKAWQAKHLDAVHIGVMEQLRHTRDYDTHSGTIGLSGEVAAGVFPIVFVDAITQAPPKTDLARVELVTVTGRGLNVVQRLVSTHAAFP